MSIMIPSSAQHLAVTVTHSQTPSLTQLNAPSRLTPKIPPTSRLYPSSTFEMPVDHKRKREDIPADIPDSASVTSNLPSLPPPSNPPPAQAPSTTKARPKRARTKTEKKDEAENTSRFHCDFCGRDLSTAIRARCAVCPDYDSCLDCFSVGAALNPHKPEHAYRLIEVVHTPIFQIGWSADEEEKLLEGLELYGVGNWDQVAKLIGSKSPLETEQHYMKVYLQSATAPLPDPSKMVPTEKVPLSEKYEDVDPKALRVMHKHQQEDAAGWMEKRQDFVYEWDNEAEDIIGDMELNEDDSKADRDLKAQVLEIYSRKLDERDKRKRFVLERGLTNFKAYQAAEKKRPKEEKELRDKLRVFMRFVPQAEMERFIKGIMDERHVRTRIDILREGRVQGAKTAEECERMHTNQTKAKNRIPPSQTEPSTMSGSQNTSQRRQRRSLGEVNTSEPIPIPNGHAADAVIAADSAAAADSKDRKPIPQTEIDPDQLPGAELLSRTEINLCTALKVTPHQYMIVKEVMIRESARNGHLRKKDAKHLVRLDPTKVYKIYDYILACGWIKSGTTSAVAARNAASNPGNTAPTPNGTKA